MRPRDIRARRAARRPGLATGLAHREAQERLERERMSRSNEGGQTMKLTSEQSVILGAIRDKPGGASTRDINAATNQRVTTRDVQALASLGLVDWTPLSGLPFGLYKLTAQGVAELDLDAPGAPVEPPAAEPAPPNPIVSELLTPHGRLTEYGKAELYKRFAIDEGMTAAGMRKLGAEFGVTEQAIRIHRGNWRNNPPAQPEPEPERLPEPVGEEPAAAAACTCNGTGICGQDGGPVCECAAGQQVRERLFEEPATTEQAEETQPMPIQTEERQTLPPMAGGPCGPGHVIEAEVLECEYVPLVLLIGNGLVRQLALSDDSPVPSVGDHIPEPMVVAGAMRVNIWECIGYGTVDGGRPVCVAKLYLSTAQDNSAAA